MERSGPSISEIRGQVSHAALPDLIQIFRSYQLQTPTFCTPFKNLIVPIVLMQSAQSKELFIHQHV
jgi:hypothetical protein